MQLKIHPSTLSINLHCSGCGSDYLIVAPNLDTKKVLTESCSNCHSAWTGKRAISTQGAVAAFKDKYSQFGSDLF